MASEREIILAAGGTGGHLTPAAALAHALAARGHRIVLLGDARSSDLAATLFAGHERHVLPSAGVAGRDALGAARGAVAIARGMIQARGLLRGAAAVVGFGSYPSVGPVLAAHTRPRRPRIILHEQNAILGGANRALARLADVLAVSHPDTARIPAGTRIVLTGNPVRPAVAALARAPYLAPDGGTIRLLVLGGSLGARVFSDIVPSALAALPRTLRDRLRVTQQCRPEDIDRVRAAYAANGIVAELASFFPDVAALLADAHLVVARAGASTVAELAAIGRPAILVPLPGAVDADQLLNARAFAQGGGGWVMPQTEFSASALTARVADALATDLVAMAARAAANGHADAAERLADLVLSTIARDTLA